MSAGYNQLVMRWKDTNGLFCTNFFCTVNQAPFANSGLQQLAADAQAISQCGLQFIQFQQTIQFNHAPTSGPYSTIYDRAVFLSTASGTGQYGQLQIPGPLQTIFKSDTVTVDMNNHLVSAFAVDAVTNLALPPNNQLATVYSGRRSRVRTNQA